MRPLTTRESAALDRQAARLAKERPRPEPPPLAAGADVLAAAMLLAASIGFALILHDAMLGVLGW